MPHHLSQLTFAWPHHISDAREDFIVTPSNAEAYQLIESWPQWPSKGLRIQGGEGSGKTHLARIWQEKSGATEILSSEDLEDACVAPAGDVFLIELDTAVQFPLSALFHLINRAMLGECEILITHRDLALRDIVLPDLRSRLLSFPIVSLSQPDDMLLKALLYKHFSDRQILVDEEVVDFLLPRVERSAAAVRDCVHLLDRLALAENRKLTKLHVARYLRTFQAGNDLSIQSDLDFAS